MTRVTKKRSRADQKLDKRARIQAAAWALFNSIGYEATSTKAVADRAGVATGTLFLYASDKADLLFLVMHDRLSDVLDERFASLPRTGLVNQALHVFGGLIDLYARWPKVGEPFLRYYSVERGPNGQKVDSLTFAFLHRLAHLITDGQARGEIAADVLPLVAAQAMFALYYAVLVGWLNGYYLSLHDAAEQMLRMSLELLFSGLKAR